MTKYIYTDSNGLYTEGTVTGVVTTCVCDSSLPTNVLVMVSNTIASGVTLVTDNTDSRSVLGYVLDKPTLTTASILTKGVISGLSGLTKGEKVYLGVDGLFTSNKPYSGYLHVLGQAIDSDKVNFDPTPSKIKLFYTPQLNLPLEFLQPIDAQSSGAYFGYTAAYDGYTLVISNFINTLEAYIYKFDGTYFNYMQKVVGGSHGACAVQGSLLVITDPYDNGNSTYEGKLYVYVYNGASWVLSQTIYSPNPVYYGMFGADISLYNNKVVVGETKGYVHIYDVVNNTLVFNTSIATSTSSDDIGKKVAINDSILAVGYYDNVLIYTYDGTNWNFLESISSPSGSSNFGYGLSLYENRLFIGANTDNAAYVYIFDGTSFTMEQDLSLLQTLPGGTSYGHAGSLYKDVLIVGDYLGEVAYVYQHDGTSWSFSQQLDSSNSPEHFGAAVVAAGSELIITATTYNTNVGRAYVYH